LLTHPLGPLQDPAPNHGCCHEALLLLHQAEHLLITQLQHLPSMTIQLEQSNVLGDQEGIAWGNLSKDIRSI
jgi:hypothetical protein